MSSVKIESPQTIQQKGLNHFMKDYTTNKRYCPHLLETKLHAVALYRQTKDISFVCRRYHISKASLMRWNKAYDGTKESLMPKSPIARIHSIQMPIPSRRSSGSRTIIVETRTFRSASYTASCGRRKPIPVIPAPSIVYSSGSDFVKKRNPPRKSPSTPESTIRRQGWG